MPKQPVCASAAVVAVLLAAGVVSADQIFDGDTFELEGQHVRLYGVDAFELDQSCLDGRGEPWRCGIAAKAALAERVQGQTLSCVAVEEDDAGRYLARCTTSDGGDLGAYLVKNGLALAYPPDTSEYIDEEAAARSASIGAWGGVFMRPWQFRKVE